MRRRYLFFTGGLKSEFVFFKKRNGNFYGYGGNGYGQFGLGICKTQNKPVRLFEKLEKKEGKVKKVLQNGYLHTFVQLNDGRIFGAGYNHYNELCCVSESGIVLNYSQLDTKYFNGDNITNVFAAGHRVFFLGQRALYGVGINYNSQLGINSTETKRDPVALNFPNFTKIHNMHHGYHHSFITTTDGKMYQIGQIGNVFNTRKMEPTLITIPNEIIDINRIHCGWNCAWIITKSNKVYAIGDNSKEELTKTLPKIVKEFTFVKCFHGNEIVDIQCGINFTIILKKNGVVLGMGNKDSFGCKKIIFSEDLDYDNRVFTIMKNIIQIECTDTSIIMIHQNGKVYVGGSNVGSRLGLGNDRNIYDVVVMNPNIKLEEIEYEEIKSENDWRSNLNKHRLQGIYTNISLKFH